MKRFLAEDETEEEARVRREAEAMTLLDSARKQLDGQNLANFIQILIDNEQSPAAGRVGVLSVLTWLSPVFSLSTLKIQVTLSVPTYVRLSLC
jgi:hypothetical protein